MKSFHLIYKLYSHVKLDITLNMTFEQVLDKILDYKLLKNTVIYAQVFSQFHLSDEQL